jgi:hypothetical protein
MPHPPIDSSGLQHMTTLAEVAPWLAFIGQIGAGFMFLGKMSSEQKNQDRRVTSMDAAFEKRIALLDKVLTDKLSEIDHKLGIYDEAYASSIRERADTSARLKAAEQALAAGEAQRERLITVTDKTRDDLTGFRARSEEQHGTMKEAQERIFRTLSSVERQLANLSTGRVATYGTDNAPPSGYTGRETAK